MWMETRAPKASDATCTPACVIRSDAAGPVLAAARFPIGFRAALPFQSAAESDKGCPEETRVAFMRSAPASSARTSSDNASRKTRNTRKPWCESRKLSAMVATLLGSPTMPACPRSLPRALANPWKRPKTTATKQQSQPLQRGFYRCGWSRFALQQGASSGFIKLSLLSRRTSHQNLRSPHEYCSGEKGKAISASQWRR